jgi:hypothetical protein
MAVPKAAVDKDDLLELWENEVWLSREIGDVEPEPVPA